MIVKTGDVVFVNIPNGIGSQQTGQRYAVVISNNVGNKHSPTVEIMPGTTKRNNSKMPTHAHFLAGECGLPFDTVFEAESKWTINKFQIKNIVGHMDDAQLERIAVAMVYATPIVMKAFDKGVQFTNTFEKISKTT